jgi:tRNA nucleotidyltransferase (CCA-adding enzyme)
MARQRSIGLARVRKQLTESTARAVDIACREAERAGLTLFLVGGAVRDLLLGSQVSDVDLVVEGKAISLARATGPRLKARVKVHERFGTASMTGNGARLDFANARREMYPSPGALPVVEPSMLEEDLRRRDFSINAMALELTGLHPGRLIDLHSGEEDLERHRIRILHDESFQDDATRLLRAVRYAGRLKFQLEHRTASAMRRDRGYLDTISGTRLRHEFERIALEDNPGDILTIAVRYGLLDAVHPAMSCSGRAKRAVRKLVDVPVGHRDAVLFCLLLTEADDAEVADAIGRLAMTNRQAETIAGFRALARQAAQAGEAPISTSLAVDMFDPRPLASVWACALAGLAPLAKLAARYLDEWRFVRTRLNGDDLLRLGVDPGPKVGLALRALRAAKLEGTVKSRGEEEAFVRALATGRTP